jgi:pimeloyl-ACP methyl ester carboxylesterase
LSQTRFYPADGFRVRGLSVRNAQGGLGATLIGIIDTDQGAKVGRHIPATLLLRGPKDIKEWSAGQAVVTLALSSGYEHRVIELAGQKIPVRTDTTTPLAYALNNTWFWELGRRQFFSYHQIVKSDVYQMQPYIPGRIPVVFIHGTFSTPTWWAEMANSLQADPVIGSRYQLWYYIYNSGNPVLFTAAQFRAALTNTIHRLDPQGADPALQQMVLIGHSQGGLLAKLAVTESRDRLWNAISDTPFAQTRLEPEDRAELEQNFFFPPVAAVKRVVFVATPHRGSYQITMWLQNFLGRFMSLPMDILRLRTDLTKVFSPSKLPPELRGMPSSVAGMSPKNPMLQVLADLPPAPGVKAHSIIAVKGDGDPKLGSDGVVKYSSAHLDYAESELIVKSGHTCQTKPATIEEVRRILLEHLNSLPPSQPAAQP